jgi:hypothetical protein
VHLFQTRFVSLSNAKLRRYPLTGRSDVTDDRPRSGLKKHQGELTTVLMDILLKKVPNEPKYSDLNARYNEFMEAARAVGIVDEAVSQVTQERKRQRVSNEQHHTVRDILDIVASNSMKSIEDAVTAPLSATTAEHSQSSQSLDQPSSPSLHDLLANLSSSGTPGVSNTAAISSFDPNALEVDVSSTEPMGILDEWLKYP